MQHKRGDTFYYAFPIPFSKPDGYYIDWELPRCQIRNKVGRLKTECTVKWMKEETTRILVLSYPTGLDSDWPVGEYKLDIQFTRISDGYVDSSTTLVFDIVDDVTKPL